jgi:hypothetical protein
MENVSMSPRVMSKPNTPEYEQNYDRIFRQSAPVSQYPGIGNCQICGEPAGVLYAIYNYETEQDEFVCNYCLKEITGE